MLDVQQAARHRGHRLVDPQGEKIGKIEAIYIDEETGNPDWALVDTGLFDTKKSLAPLSQARADGEDLQVPYGKDKVKNAPTQLKDDREVSAQEVAQLYEYYGIAGSGNGQRGGPGHDTDGPNTDTAMTRSEEEVRVGTRQHEAERVRLRKHVVTENVQQTVPVSHEEVRVEREPITEQNRDAATSGPAFHDEEHEVVLHAEEPVVDKREVPKERVRLEKQGVTEQQQVSDSARREEIEVERTGR